MSNTFFCRFSQQIEQLELPPALRYVCNCNLVCATVPVAAMLMHTTQTINFGRTLSLSTLFSVQKHFIRLASLMSVNLTDGACLRTLLERLWYDQEMQPTSSLYGCSDCCRVHLTDGQHETRVTSRAICGRGNQRRQVASSDICAAETPRYNKDKSALCYSMSAGALNIIIGDEWR